MLIGASIVACCSWRRDIAFPLSAMGDKYERLGRQSRRSLRPSHPGGQSSALSSQREGNAEQEGTERCRLAAPAATGPEITRCPKDCGMGPLNKETGRLPKSVR